MKETKEGGTATIVQPTVEPFVDDSTDGTTGVIPGNAGGAVAISIPVGNIGVVHDYQAGPGGGGGRNGYGVEICIGAWKFEYCFTAGRSAHAGGTGGNGPTVNRTITGAKNENIQSVTPGLSGVTLISQGGNGGNGGNAYGVLPSKPGGAAGLGGAVIGNSSIEISTSGERAHGILAQSRGGSGGNGGSGYILSSGSEGGPASAGGTVELTNSGKIVTTGNNAVGILAQSIGGGGGAVFHNADANNVTVTPRAANSGNGGAVKLAQVGNVTTTASESFGIVLQSIGGGGGFVDGVFAGTAGGVGIGGAIDLTIDGNVIVDHETSTAVLAQSTGTSGGNITVKLETDHVIYAGAKGAGVDLREGADNKLSIWAP